MSYDLGERAYYRWTSKHPDVDIERRVFDSIYRLGHKDCLRTSSALSPHIANFTDYVDWVRELEEVGV